MVLTASQPLPVTVFFDGKPGHEKQTKALLAALGATVALQVHEISVIRTPVSRLENWLRLLCGLGSRSDTMSQLLIGTGSSTHPALLLQARTAVRNHRRRPCTVTVMRPSSLLLRFFDLCLIPEHDAPPARDNILATFGPPCLPPPPAKRQSDRGLILVGGPSRHTRWDSDATLAQIATILAATPDIHWTISSSRRTPDSMLCALDTLATNTGKVSFFRAADTDPGWIEGRYATADQVWITADSVSMVYEALTAGCRVGILPVPWRRQNNKCQQGLTTLLANGLVSDYPTWLGQRTLPPPSRPLREAERCATAILTLLTKRFSSPAGARS